MAPIRGSGGKPAGAVSPIDVSTGVTMAATTTSSCRTDLSAVAELATQLRIDSIRSSTSAGSGHPTSSMSAADLLAVLLTRHLRYDWNHLGAADNDHLIFSKGHASPLLYAVFKAVGVISDAELMTGYRRFGERLQGHPTPVLPGVDVATGSLGQGLPDGVGIALAGKYLERRPYQVWVLCDDGELAEGSIWEALDKASYYRLSNLVAIVDVNRPGQRGETELGWHLGDYARRAEAFGARVPHPGARLHPHGRHLRIPRRRRDRPRRPLPDGVGRHCHVPRGTRVHGAVPQRRHQHRRPHQSHGRHVRHQLPSHHPRRLSRPLPPRRDLPRGWVQGPAFSDDDQVTLIGAGVTLHECLHAADLLAEHGIPARVIDCCSVKPIDAASLAGAAAATAGRIVIAEDHHPEGGLGSAVTGSLLAAGVTDLHVAHLTVRKMPARVPAPNCWAGLASTPTTSPMPPASFSSARGPGGSHRLHEGGDADLAARRAALPDGPPCDSPARRRVGRIGNGGHRLPPSVVARARACGIAIPMVVTSAVPMVAPACLGSLAVVE
jgi:transketolase N-terminal domain/subunit